LSLAASEGYTDCAKILVERGADVAGCDQDKHGWTPLHQAAYQGHLACLSFLLDAGGPLEAQTLKGGRTVLSLAARYGRTRCVEILVERNANVNAVDQFGETPLHRAAHHGHLDTAQALLRRNANVNAVDQFGETPLHHAAHYGHLGIAQAVLRSGAAIDTINHRGRSPLITAARRGHAHVTQELVASGAAIGLMSKSRKTALMYAKEYGHSEVAQILEPAILSRAPETRQSGQAPRRRERSTR
jgi:ankyrin repeat protein